MCRRIANQNRSGVDDHEIIETKQRRYRRQKKESETEIIKEKEEMRIWGNEQKAMNMKIITNKTREKKHQRGIRTTAKF